MKLSKSLATALMTLLLSGAAAGQDEIQPVSPVLDIVTVDPVTGFCRNKMAFLCSPDVGSYVVYTYSGGTATAIDTVRSPFITTFTHTASAARYRSVTYVVAAVDSSQNISPLSNPLSTVWLSAVNDECTGKITVTWTPYVNLQHPAVSQTLHIRSSQAHTSQTRLCRLPQPSLSTPGTIRIPNTVFMSLPAIQEGLSPLQTDPVSHGQ
jgi:hypothetical protein